MSRFTFSSSRAAARLLAGLLALPLFTTQAAPKPVRELLPRPSWQASRFQGTPEPPAPFHVQRRFPQLTFRNPVELTRAPGLDRWFVAEVNGRILSFPAGDPSRAQADEALNLPQAIPGATKLYGLEFHPGFATNRLVYVCYITANLAPEGTRVSEFRMSELDPPRLDPGSERILLTWLSGGHNGGSLKFGHDGFLYVSAGDGEVPFPPDPRKTGQDVSDFLSSVLRIDVNRRSDGLPYAIPSDNPFVGRPGIRPEIWAYGFRNPWRMSFDRANGDLWVGDVGWELWEMVFRVQKAGNYGWSIREGRQPVHPEGRRGPTPILPPTIDHPHVEARSITGGFVYHGSRLPDLKGQYIYGDYVTGLIWAARYNTGTGQVTAVREISRSGLAIICFGEAPDGELLIADYQGGLYALEPNHHPHNPAVFPRRLSETGLFISTKEQRPLIGVVPYRIRTEPWMDGTTAQRWMALPGTEPLDTYRRNRFQEGEVRGAWIFPAGTVFAKTVQVETEAGNPASNRKLETQILHRDGATWRAYNYVWNATQTDAELAPAEGADTEIRIRDPQAPGGERRLKWHHAGRAECLICHMPRSGVIYGFHPEQLDVPVPPDAPTTQLARLDAQGYFLDRPKPDLALAAPHESQVSLETRARSYLYLNCGHCHRNGGGGTATIDVQLQLPLEQTGLLDAHPSQGDFGIPDARLIAPGDPGRSLALFRMAKLGRGHMPMIGSTEVDSRGLHLLAEWIAGMQEAPDTRLQRARDHWGRDRTEEAWRRDLEAALRHPEQALYLALALDDLPPNQRWARGREAADLSAPPVRDLFERFLPASERTQRLGPGFQPRTVLALTGDATRGRELFLAPQGAHCLNCHEFEGRGRALGPDLRTSAARYDRAGLLEQIRQPSQVLDPAFATWTVDLKSGLSFTGFIREETGDKLQLLDLAGQTHELRKATIEARQASRLSAMPEGLLDTLTAQEAADLLAFIESLKTR